MTRVLLVGNPNCGKTTLFNALTGENQRIGNWPGVTVEKKTGLISEQGIEVIDLPGLYSLSLGEEASQDEQIAAKTVAKGEMDVIVNVVDACHLERHLYLTSQLLELRKPIILALTMVDLATQQGISIDTEALSRTLACSVVSLDVPRQQGIPFLIEALVTIPAVPPLPELPFSKKLLPILHATEACLLSLSTPILVSYKTRRFLEGGTSILSATERVALEMLPSIEEQDIVMADARYTWIHHVVSLVQQKCADEGERWTARLDRVVLHRIWALPIFLGTMYMMFLFAINIGGAFQDFFDISTNAIFVQGSAWLLHYFHAPTWLIALLSNGVGKGLNTTLTFVPVIAAMFFFLAFLEASGYMARAAFVVDRIMRGLKLPGKAFVPMIVGFGCNVPAIMAARTLDSDRDRLLTILMSPFMSCSARLAIYAVFVAAFFPRGGQDIVFSLYLIGIIMAVLTGMILRKTVLYGPTSPLILELPVYHRPTIKRLVREMTFRLRYFVGRAAKVIIPVSVVLGGLNALTLQGDLNFSVAAPSSILSLLGRALTPLFAPFGLTADNWPATVGLLSGTLAKEVVVGTLNTLYTTSGKTMASFSNPTEIMGLLKDAVWSIPTNLSELAMAFSNPILASAPQDDISTTLYGTMVQRFDGKIGAYAYLLFILLYIPCVSTMAVIRQEANRSIMWFSIFWSCFVAYSVAVLFYQGATVLIHPLQTLFWYCSLGGMGLVVFYFLKKHVLWSEVFYVNGTS